jgi:hypothetical protein
MPNRATVAVAACIVITIAFCGSIDSMFPALTTVSGMMCSIIILMLLTTLRDRRTAERQHRRASRTRNRRRRAA